MRSTSARTGTRRRPAALPLVALAVLTLALPACAVSHRHVHAGPPAPTFRGHARHRGYVPHRRHVRPAGRVVVHAEPIGGAIAAIGWGLFFTSLFCR